MELLTTRGSQKFSDMDRGAGIPNTVHFEHCLRIKVLEKKNNATEAKWVEMVYYYY